MIKYFLLLQICTYLIQAEQYDLALGILKLKGVKSQQELKFCYEFYPSLSIIPNKEKNVNYSNIDSEKLWDLCNEVPSSLDVKNLIVFAENNFTRNCSYVKQAEETENADGVATLFVGNRFLSKTEAENGSHPNFGIISNLTYTKILRQSENETVMLGAYSPSSSDKATPFNLNLVFIWIMAEASVVIGAFWSGHVRHKLYLKEQGVLVEGPPRGGVVEAHGPREESSLPLSPRVVMIMVAAMSVILVTLWFLLKYVVYIVIVMFMIASFVGVYCCLEPLVLRMPCGRCRTPHFNLYLIRGTLEVRQLLLAVASAALPITWFVLRKEPYSWVLQDVLGIAFSINTMRVVRLPNLKICTLMLTLLVVYDIFFVFITPFITSSGTSIMVEVAQGGDSNEEMPGVFKVPYVYAWGTRPEVLTVCGLGSNYSLLGFGDILVPGLLVSFAHSFDLRVRTPCRLYFAINAVAYGLGLLVTFVVLVWLRSAQPALFYLVPFTLVPTVVAAALRDELATMWSGNDARPKTDADEQSDYRPPNYRQVEAPDRSLEDDEKDSRSGGETSALET